MGIDDDATRGELTSLRGRSAGDARTSLVVYYGDKVDVIALGDGASMTLGRSKPADIVVPEGNLSRQHARFTATDAGVKVEDLGSTNGTHYKGKRVQEVVLGAGDSVTLGKVTVSVSRAETRADLLGDFVGYYDFAKRLRDEVERARAFRRGVAVFFVRALPSVEGDTHVAGWAGPVRERLRPVDRMALYGDRSAFILAPETDEPRARMVANAIVEDDPRLVVGVALHQATAEELLEQARSLGRSASAASRVVIAGYDALQGAGEPLFVSPCVVELEELIERVAHARVPVLITGETGSGKEVVARAIHQRGPRAQGPMLAVSCGAMPSELVEDILFGHVAFDREVGALEGATEARAGLFEQASGGTLFLDEVAELSPRAQASLLRVLEEKKVRRLGAGEEIPVDVRVLAATNKSLRALADTGAFRADLLFRLNPVTLVVPPLRERPDDLDPLIDRFVEEASLGAGAKVRGIEPEARAALKAARWPGNVRQLRTAIEEAVLSCTREQIALSDLPAELRAAARPEPAPPAVDLRARVRAYEEGLIREALAQSAGDQVAAARSLGISLRALLEKMKTHALH
ncbi:MAG: sigma 54-interacting transcriptional regulator [Sandaracinaceae bacterium]|nr:sigma 54-interacting transcriptional regulator [Sandaracinaceae bacterium]